MSSRSTFERFVRYRYEIAAAVLLTASALAFLAVAALSMESARSNTPHVVERPVVRR